MSVPLRWSATGQAVAWSLARPEAAMQVTGLRGEDLAFLDERTLAVVEVDAWSRSWLPAVAGDKDMP